MARKHGHSLDSQRKAAPCPETVVFTEIAFKNCVQAILGVDVASPIVVVLRVIRRARRQLAHVHD